MRGVARSTLADLLCFIVIIIIIVVVVVVIIISLIQLFALADLILIFTHEVSHSK